MNTHRTTFKKQAIALAIGAVFSVPVVAAVHTYDALSRVVESKEPNGRFVRYVRDAGGNILINKEGLINHYIAVLTDNDDVLIYKPNGELANRFKVNSKTAGSLTKLDIDGDETDEIAVTGLHPRENFIEIYSIFAKHNPNAENKPLKTFTIPDNTAQLAAGNLNQDQIPEILAISNTYNNGSISVYSPNGQSLSALTGFPSGVPVSLAVGDVDGDGKLDPIIGDLTANQITVKGVTLPVFQSTTTRRAANSNANNNANKNNDNAPVSTPVVTTPSNNSSNNSNNSNANNNNQNNGNNNNNDNKVSVCHNGNLISISSNALDSHLAHGDTLSCSSGNTSTNTNTNTSTNTSANNNSTNTSNIIYGARVATGNIDNDYKKMDEIIVATAANGSRIEIYSGDGKKLINAFQAFDNNDGLIIATGDIINNDNRADIVAANGTDIKIFKANGTMVSQFTAIKKNEKILSLAVLTETLFYNENKVLVSSWQPSAPPTISPETNTTLPVETNTSNKNKDNKNITTDTLFENVTIGKLTIAPNVNVTLGKGVRFKNAQDIPQGINLTGIFEKIENTVPSIKVPAALNLNTIIAEDAPTLLQQIQSLANMPIQQDQNTGNLIATIDNLVIELKPIKIIQNQTIRADFYPKTNGSYQIVTPTGQQIDLISVPQDLTAFSNALPNHQLSIDETGKIIAVPTDNSLGYYVGIANFYSQPISDNLIEGLHNKDALLFPTGNQLLRNLIFKDSSNQSRQQIIYPYPDQFGYFAQFNQTNGLVSFNFNNNVYQGLLDYMVLYSPQNKANLEITYPNGNKQLIFPLP